MQLALQTTLVGEGVGETDELVVVGAAENEDEAGGSGTKREMKIMKTLNYCALAHYTQICGSGLMSKGFTGLPRSHRIIWLEMPSFKSLKLL